MKCLAVLFLLALSLPCLAQDSAAYQACNAKAKAQPDLNQCANDEAARADADLNDVYRKLLAKAASDADAVAAIKAFERAWLIYRDAYIEAVYPGKDKQALYGSEYLMDVGILRAKLTRQQITALNDLLQQL